MTRAEFADAINKSPTGQALNLYCEEERIRRWEAGEVLWPSSDYRKALQEVTSNPKTSALSPATRKTEAN
jgi:hypothetical protein